MPRYPRNLIAVEGLAHHKIWRGHNKEWNIASYNEKFAYLSLLAKNATKQNPLRALCLMSNHTHEIYHIGALGLFSNFMRQHHGQYGQLFNKHHNRSGKVAQDRPKTIPIETRDHEMMATFYIHANPLRAGLVKDANQYLYSTHKLFAFGVKPPWLKQISNLRIIFPAWYLALGKTPKERQKRYRQLFDLYLRDRGLTKQEHSVYGFGNLLWLTKRRKQILSKWHSIKAISPP